MSISSRKEKTYGILHTEYCFYFFGFAKKINSKKPQKINIYLDDNLIDTILANKCIEEIDNTYDLNGFSFSYKLPKKYIGEKHIISFRNYDSNEDLDNSPYELIEKDNPNFKEIQNNLEGNVNQLNFFNSLNNINPEKIKEMYCPNSIGFLGTEENLQNVVFMNYIREIKIRFPLVEIKCFYINSKQKKLLDIVLSNFDFKVTTFKLSNIYDLAKETEIIICNETSSIDKKVLNTTIAINCINILVIYIYLPHAKLSLSDYDNILINTNHPIISCPDKFNLNKHDIKKFNSSVTQIFKNKFNLENENFNYVEDLYYYKFIELGLSNNHIKKYHKLIFKEIF